MIKAINSLSFTQSNKNKNKIPFGNSEVTISKAADYAKKIYELRKQKLFFKIFPFFNKKPGTTFMPTFLFTMLTKEENLNSANGKKLEQELENKYNRLFNKRNRK